MDEKKDFIDKQFFFHWKFIESFIEDNLHPIWFKAYGYNAPVTNLAHIQNIAHFNTSPCATEISSKGKWTDTKWFHSSMTFIKD